MTAEPLHPIAETILQAVGPARTGFDARSFARVEDEIRRALGGPRPEAQLASEAILTVLGLLDAAGEASAVRALTALSEQLVHERAERDQGTAQRIAAFQGFEGNDRPRPFSEASAGPGETIVLRDLRPPPLRG